MSKRNNPYQGSSLPPKKRYRNNQGAAVPRLRIPYHLGGPLYVSRPLPMAGRGAPTARYAHNPRLGELKTVDYVFSGNYVAPYVTDQLNFPPMPITTATGNIQCVNLVQQGTSIAQRIGNKICMRSLRIRLKITDTGNAAASPPYQIRMMLCYDRNPPGTYPATNTILSTVRQDSTVQNGTVDASLNPAFYDRFVVLRDWYQTLPADVGTGSELPNDQATWNFDDFVSLKNLETTFSGNASPMTISNVSVGALYLFVLGTALAGVSDGYCLTGTLRLRFRDT